MADTQALIVITRDAARISAAQRKLLLLQADLLAADANEAAAEISRAQAESARHLEAIATVAWQTLREVTRLNRETKELLGYSTRPELGVIEGGAPRRS